MAACVALAVAAPAPSLAQAGQSVPGPAYRINPGDELDILVWGDERLQRSVRVLPDGTFAFPLVGQVVAAGRLPAELERVISTGLQPQYRGPVPQVTISALLAENWSANAAVGVSYRNRDFAGDSNSSVGLAVDGSVCRALEMSRLCARVSRSSQNSVSADLLTNTSAGLDYSLTLDQNSSIQLSGNYIHYDGRRILNRSVSSNYFVTSAAYNRRINDRLSGGVNGSFRKLSQFGPDPDSDASASVFLRYRFGDLQ